MEKKQRKVVHIIAGFGYGGAERMLLDLCRSLDRSRFSLAVWAVGATGPLQAEFERAGISTRCFGKRPGMGLRTIRDIRDALEREMPDIVHTHLFAGDTWGRAAAYLAGSPAVIATEHNCNVDEGSLKRVVKKLLSLGTARIVAVSGAVRAYSIRHDLIDPARITVIYNGIDLARFPYRGERRIGGSSIRCVVVGRLEPQKGHAVLLQALPQLIARYPGLSLDIIGEGSLRRLLEDQARDLGISESVRFLGARPVDAGILGAYDVLCMPSRWEGLGIAAIEAQAVGVPVLASAVPGLDEVVIDGETGVTFAPENPDALAAALARLAGDPTATLQMVHAARRRVEAIFSLEGMASAYTALYEDIARK